MTQTDKAALANRLDGVGLVTPTLAEGQPEQMDTVRDIETITGEILEAKRVGGEAIITIGQRREGVGGHGPGAHRRRPGGVGDRDRPGAVEYWRIICEF